MKKNKRIVAAVAAANAVRKVTIITLLLILMTVLFFSCTPTLKVSTDYDRSANFTAYKTFSVYDLKTKGDVSQLNRDRIIRYIKSEMTRKGFVETDNNPDLMINAVTVLKDKRSFTASTNFYGYGGFYRPYGYWGVPASASTTVSAYNYKDGSLVIDVVDAKTKKMIWEGMGYAQVDKKPKNPEEVISEVVNKIMQSFPVNQSLSKN